MDLRGTPRERILVKVVLSSSLTPIIWIVAFVLYYGNFCKPIAPGREVECFQNSFAQPPILWLWLAMSVLILLYGIRSWGRSETTSIACILGGGISTFVWGTIALLTALMG